MSAPAASAPRVVDHEGAVDDALLRSIGVDVAQPAVVVVGAASALDQLSGPTADVLRGSIRDFLVDVLGVALAELKPVVLTGGTDAGVMAMAGQALGDASELTGVAPKTMVDAGAARLEPNHSAIDLTRGATWSSETRTMFHLAEGVTAGVMSGVVLLINGGSVAEKETDRFLRGGWPVLIVPKSGGTAERLLREAKRHRRRLYHLLVRWPWSWDRGRRSALGAPGARRLWGDLRHADVEEVSPDADRALEQLSRRLSRDSLAKTAWSRFSNFDRRATWLQRCSRWSQAVASGMALVTLAGAPAWVAQVLTSLGGDSLLITITAVLAALPVFLVVIVAFLPT